MPFARADQSLNPSRHYAVQQPERGGDLSIRHARRIVAEGEGLQAGEQLGHIDATGDLHGAHDAVRGHVEQDGPVVRLVQGGPGLVQLKLPLTH
jgi:hypothetical protein